MSNNKKAVLMLSAVFLYIFWEFIGQHIFSYYYSLHKRDQFLEKYPTVATIGNSGGFSDTDFYGVDAYVKDTRGGGADLGYGAVAGYPGASASIGIGVPKHIKAEWGLANKDKTKYDYFYRIDADIDSELAKKKIDTMQSYYKNYKNEHWGTMQLTVNRKKIYLFFTLACLSKLDDCSPKDNADPNGYIVPAPSGSGQVVVLFEGEGEVSSTPFKGTSFDRKY
ncbi:hypothetical protein [Vibrio algivorus]|uniref:Uncharacterized protein n=1 Tax=Vibrio algivorus TaxID=1667024 RepID=A0A557NTX9_9VIBR|nr:hypothetical protein [Vibrio algivorus]TVO31876.1 hypothetical protein FOF44_17590 [Vibrio algivorus]